MSAKEISAPVDIGNQGSGNVNLGSVANGVFLPGLTASKVLQLDGSNKIISGNIPLSDLTPSGVGTIYSDGTSILTANGAAGQVWTSNAPAAPSWQALPASGVTTFSAGTTGLTPNVPTSGAIVLAGTLAIANGGTNSSTALNNNRVMVSSGGAIVESAAATDGQLLIGGTGVAPAWSTLTAGTNIGVVSGSNSITLNVSTATPSVRGVVYGNTSNAPLQNDTFGYQAGNSFTSGVENVLVGYQAGTAITTGNQNICIGYQVCNIMTSGSQNIVITTTVAGLTTGTNNTLVGNGAGTSTSSGTYNTFVGDTAGANTTIGSSNIGVGRIALPNLVSGSNNIGIGYSCGTGLSTGSENIYIGHDNQASAGNVTNEYVFGNIITGTGTGYTFDYASMQAGAFSAMSIDPATGQVVHAVSSMRYKTALPDPPLSQFVQYTDRLVPRQFYYNSDPKQKPHIGYFAEEVLDITGPSGNPVFNEMLVWTQLPDTTQPPIGTKKNPVTGADEPVYPMKPAVDGIKYENFVVPLVCYCKWLAARCATLEAHAGLTPSAPTN